MLRLHADDRRALLLLACVFAPLYAYFFQGGGWNQNSHFDTIRALVERGSMEITPYAENTGDIALFEGRKYSNKPPGLALWGAPAYFVIHHVERALGIQLEAAATILANAHMMTFYTSGLPACVLVLLVYLYFRREQSTPAQALALAGGFGAGSLLFPYSGVMMSHALSACLLFAAWYLVRSAERGTRAVLAAGLCAGGAALTEFLAGPAVVLFALYLVARRRTRVLPVFLAGPALMAGVLLLIDTLCFGSPTTTAQSLQASEFHDAQLFLGTFDWPQPVRLYWLSVHPYRGLLYCCPLFLICVLSLVRLRSPRTISLEALVCALVFAYFLLFNLSFNGWTGGWGFGPRYLVPALPFLYILARPGFIRFPRLARALMVVSTAVMLCVTAVMVTLPGPNFGPPPPADPVRFVLRELAAGRVSIWGESPTGPSGLDPTPQRYWNSYNLGELAGLHGLLSLVPVVLLLAAFALAVARWSRRPVTTSAPT